MKLQSLNAAIDAADDVWVRFSFGKVPLKKGALKDALKAHHGGQRTAETGLSLTADNFLTWDLPRKCSWCGITMEAQVAKD